MALRPPGTLVRVPDLLHVVAGLRDIPPGDGHSAGPTVYAQRPWTLSADAVVLRGADLPAGLTTASGHHYLLEVALALEAVEVWSEWRDGAVPTPEQATAAVIHYAEHDAYEPVQDGRTRPYS
jgi:hypothetical protein